MLSKKKKVEYFLLFIDMKSKQIRAITGNHALLRRNTIPTIGRVQIKKRMNLVGEFVTISEVIFHYGNKSCDYFEFVDDKLVYYLISRYTQEYIINAYNESIERERLLEDFVNSVTKTYVFHELGF